MERDVLYRQIIRVESRNYGQNDARKQHLKTKSKIRIVLLSVAFGVKSTHGPCPCGYQRKHDAKAEGRFYKVAQVMVKNDTYTDKADEYTDGCL